MYEHIVTLVIRTEHDYPEQWDWSILLDLASKESVTLVSSETHEPDEYMRLDTVFEGALDSQCDYTEEEIWEQWNHELQLLETHYSNKDWTISIYDTRPYPPELVREHRNDL